jgi:hypothetical protein
MLTTRYGQPGWRGEETRQGGGMVREMMSAVGQQLTECSIDVVGMVRIP